MVHPALDSILIKSLLFNSEGGLEHVLAQIYHADFAGLFGRGMPKYHLGLNHVMAIGKYIRVQLDALPDYPFDKKSPSLELR